MNRRAVVKTLPLMLAGISSSPTIWRLLARVKSAEWNASTDLERDLEAITELIIPETDTPGAISAGVPHFIDLIVDEVMTDEEALKFREGLSSFSSTCAAQNNAPFYKLASQFQTAYLNLLEELEDPFFQDLKRWTLIGYFTSEAGMKKALNYDPIPGKFVACVKVTAETKGAASYF